MVGIWKIRGSLHPGKPWESPSLWHPLVISTSLRPHPFQGEEVPVTWWYAPRLEHRDTHGHFLSILSWPRKNQRKKEFATHKRDLIGTREWRPRDISCPRCVADCCSVLHCVVVCWVCCSRDICCPRCVAVCCSVLQCVAVCCSMLQCVVVCWPRDICCPRCVAVCCNVLQCVAACWNVLQRVAVFCRVLQCVACPNTRAQDEDMHIMTVTCVKIYAFCSGT